MTTKVKVIIGSVVVLTAFAFGRYSAPTKVKTEIKTVEVEKKKEDTKTDTNRDKHKETTIVEVINKDGTKQTTTKTIEDDKTARKTDEKLAETDSKATDKTKEVTRASGISLSALAGYQIGSNALNPMVYGGHLSTPIFGPITIGAWGLTGANTSMGLSLGLNF